MFGISIEKPYLCSRLKRMPYEEAKTICTIMDAGIDMLAGISRGVS